jgi:iron complex outermembrane receptor protein
MTNTSYRSFLAATVTALALTSLTGTALAQGARAIEEIVVTTRKRVESVQEVPVSVSTMTGDDVALVTSNGADLRFLNGRLPSIHVESSFGRSFPRFYVRGLGNNDFDLNSSQPVSLVYDEVVLENPIIKGKPVFDLERLEVARGPQGTLFGRNTPAGVIKFVTKKPSEELEGYANLSYGTYETIEFEGAVGGPLSETLSGRVSAQWVDRDDWIDNAAPGFEASDQLGGYTQWAVRGQLLFEPNENFNALATVHAWDIDGTARIFHANIVEPGTNSLRAGFDPDTVFLDAGARNSQDVEAWGASLVWEYDFGAVTLTSITGYETVEMLSRGDVDGGFGGLDLGPFPPVLRLPQGPGEITTISETADGIPDLDQITQEFRLTGEYGERVNWLLGFYYFNEDAQFDTFNYDTFNGGIPAGFSFVQQETDAWALFGSADYRLGDRWTFTAGLRWSDDEKDFAAERPIGVFQGPTVAPITENTDDDFVSWDLSAAYAVNDDVNVYGRIATSSRAPSIQGRILFAVDFSGGLDPDNNGVSVANTEEIISGEVGIKSELFDNRLRLNLAGYIFQMDDQQVSAVGGATNTVRLLNVDTTDGYGFEADIEALLIENLTITMGLSYNNTEFDDPNLVTSPCAICTITDPIVNDFVQLDGNTLLHAPEWNFSGIARYGVPVGAAGELYGAVDWAYHDEVQFFLYESLEFRDDFFELGLRLGYIHDDRYEIALFGRNITDEEKIKHGIDFSNNVGMVNDPITWGVQVSARFGQ